MNGFEVFNQAGFKIAGSDYPNLVLYGKTTLVTQNFNVNGPGFNFVSYVGSAVVPDDKSTLRFYRSPAGHKLVEQGGRIFSDVVGASFECYSFGPALPDSASSGLEIRDQAGGVKFSTGQPFLKLVGVYVDTHPAVATEDLPPPYQYQTAYVEGARKLAFQFSNAHYYYRLVRTNTGKSASYNSVRIASVTSSGLYQCKFMTKYQWTQSWPNSRVWQIPNRGAPQRMLIADVTGL
ncbi:MULTISPECIES: hypothetical protein [unclassified Pseudomonas]|uniref:hypothetical protein n=1 Tax=unclassified Pseudomonas TaxID=196821 RepID=UPI001F395847|nr:MULTISPECIES: hypothetical protein [unclassified Pseudomonas]MCF5233097.1 hypothetical protein [Pseudomonas sp. PA-5-4H]MCF5237408.1 hypothetical protein [Pseudomonas sp. PA-5-4G]MCF5245978.1 hypothetical protein [Pseudomonas sp. PA-5-4B]MCF5252694.1 hypothetical protein [Pseudomonas sp. PA-5-4B]MCF5257959.1 hypothetical protein [Pseudomonas sp. PA-5-4A]